MIFKSINISIILMMIMIFCIILNTSVFGYSKLIDYGTENRPQLTKDELKDYSISDYFSDSGMLENPVENEWIPSSIKTYKKADYIVGSNLENNLVTHDTIQKAVNEACELEDKTKRVYIKVLPGTYTGVVYVPIDAPPITLYGAKNNPDNVKIQLSIDAIFTPNEYRETVNPSNQFEEGDPAWYMYEACANLESSKIDTPCSAVFWVQSDNFQLKNVTITNTLLDDGDYQAVALRTDGDKTQIEGVRLIGRQDTFWVNSGDKATVSNKQGAYSLTKIARVYIKDTYIEGDVDFVMGRANAVFNKCTFKIVSTRKSLGIVFAPNTLPQNSYGFLVINCIFKTDKGSENSEFEAYLGRSWDQGTSSTGYIPGASPNGQLIIKNSYIGENYNKIAPWYNSAATSGREFAGNISELRDLDDPNYNRLWEYKNFGPGSY
jgi:pectinesterase